MSISEQPPFTNWLRRHGEQLRDITVLTGAGISAESGIPTFRGQDGLWRGMDPSDLFTPEALASAPELTWQMYDELRTRIAAAEPNPGHYALAVLGRLRRVVLATQNIDGLHQRAGSAPVFELHGSLWRLRCDACAYLEENAQTPLPALPPVCPTCAGLLRPDIVLFSEPLPVESFSRAREAAESCHLMLVVGTSGVVYPAAGLPRVARAHGAVVVEVNPHDTHLSSEVDFSVRATAAQALPEIVAVLDNR